MKTQAEILANAIVEMFERQAKNAEVAEEAKTERYKKRQRKRFANGQKKTEGEL